MIIVATINGNTTTFDNYEDLHKATFSPDVWDNTAFVELGRLSGGNYESKKAEVREKAIDFQYIDEGGLSLGEVAEISAYFENYGRRYGLLTEFRENGIC